MFSKSSVACRSPLAILVGLAALGMAAAPASAAKRTLTYQCTYPLIGEAPLSVDFEVSLPPIGPGGEVTTFKTDAAATASGGTRTLLSLIGAVRIDGRASVTTTYSRPGAASEPLVVPLTFDPFTVPSTLDAPIVLRGAGKSPLVRFPSSGGARLTIDSIGLSLRATKADGTAVILPGSGTDSDGDASTFDVTCRLDPIPQDTAVVTTETLPNATVSTILSESATVRWSPAPDYTGGYVVTYVHGNVREDVEVAQPPVTLTDLVPNTDYRVSVAFANASSRPIAVAEFRTSLGAPTTPPRQQLDQTYICTYPFVGEAKLGVHFTSNLPRIVAEDAPVEGWRLTVEGGASEASLRQLGAATIGGTVTVGGTFILPGGGQRLFRAPLALYNFPPDYPFGATGEFPTQTFLDQGTVSVNLDSILLSLRARRADGSAVVLPGADTDSDANPQTFDVPCRLDVIEPRLTELATVIVGANANPAQPTTPAPPVDATTPTGTTPAGTTPRATTPAGTTPAATTPAGTTPASTTPRPCTGGLGGCSGPAYRFDLGGSAQLRTLVKGSVPLTGVLDTRVELATGNTTSTLVLKPTQGRLVALGFLPLVAKLTIVSTQPVTGTLVGDRFTASAVVRIKLPSVTLFGLQLAGGENCQAAKASSIALASTGPFSFFDRSTVTGTFAISNLTGCGALNGLVSPLTAGKGNVLVLGLTPAG